MCRGHQNQLLTVRTEICIGFPGSGDPVLPVVATRYPHPPPFPSPMQKVEPIVDVSPEVEASTGSQSLKDQVEALETVLMQHTQALQMVAELLVNVQVWISRCRR